MNKSFAHYKGIGTTMLVLCLIAVACNAFSLVMDISWMMKCASLLRLTGCAAALNYIFKGYSKNAAASYKAFMVILFVNLQLSTVPLFALEANQIAMSAFMHFSGCLMAAFALCLGVGQNMGAKLSKGMALTIAILATAQVVLSIAYYEGVLRSGSFAYNMVHIRCCFFSFMGWMAYAMTCAKYADKAERGTK